jgi:hypothetical protein
LTTIIKKIGNVIKIKIIELLKFKGPLSSKNIKASGFSEELKKRVLDTLFNEGG